MGLDFDMKYHILDDFETFTTIKEKSSGQLKDLNNKSGQLKNLNLKNSCYPIDQVLCLV